LLASESCTRIPCSTVNTSFFTVGEEKRWRSCVFLLPWKKRQEYPIQNYIAMVV
jgi:hypothetical protein